MAKHQYITNEEGGYFYRFHPKIAKIKIPQDEDQRYDLFSSLPDTTGHYKLTEIYGTFIRKYNDGHTAKGKHNLVIELNVEAEIVFTCNTTFYQEERTLTSVLYISVPDKIFNYPFKKDSVYIIKTNEVKLITP